MNAKAWFYGTSFHSNAGDGRGKCVDCGNVRALSYDTNQCHECEAAERERELDAIDELTGGVA